MPTTLKSFFLSAFSLTFFLALLVPLGWALEGATDKIQTKSAQPEAAQPASPAEPAPAGAPQTGTPQEPGQPADQAAVGEAPAPYVPPSGNEWVEFCGTASPEDIKKALDAGADPNFVSPGGLTPLLSAAAFNRNVDSAKALLEAGANHEAVESRFGLNALMLAASHNPLPEMIDFLISKGLSVDFQNFQGGTALIQAAASNPNPAVAEALIKAGAKVNSPDSMGATPLMHAAGYGKTTVIRKLLELGADIKAVDDAGDGPLAWAARSNVDSGAIFELLKAGADPKARNLRGQSPLYHSAVNPNSDAMAVLLQATGSDLSLFDASEGSALFAAAYFNPNVNVARRLLSLGQKADETHLDGMTVLMATLVNPEPAMTKLILSQGVNPNETDGHGRTALMLSAAVSEDPVVPRLILGAGGNPLLTDEEGLTAFDYALKNDNAAVKGLFESLKGLPRYAGLATQPPKAVASDPAGSAPTVSTPPAPEAAPEAVAPAAADQSPAEGS